MKDNYELPSRHKLLCRAPVIIRVDGKAHHTYTKGLCPFNKTYMNAMEIAAFKVAQEMQGFAVAYLQSDEVSFFLRDYETIFTQPWLGYIKSKLETITASIFTAHFNDCMFGVEKSAYFDARAFNVPREEVTNYFLWRAKDWERNSINMYCQQFFSHKELLNKTCQDRHNMLHSIDKNWSKDLNNQEKNGSWLIDKNFHYDILPKYELIDTVISEFI